MNILDSFPAIRIDLIVSIGGDILSEMYKVHLGGSLVSAPRDSESIIH